jgi:hypothetical protein
VEGRHFFHPKTEPICGSDRAKAHLNREGQRKGQVFGCFDTRHSVVKAVRAEKVVVAHQIQTHCQTLNCQIRLMKVYRRHVPTEDRSG